MSIDSSKIKQPSPAMIAASRWYAKLASGSARHEDIAAWEQWKNSAPENSAAWQQLEDTNRQFQQVSPAIGMATLKLASGGRRRVIKQLILLATAGTVGWYGYREQPWREMVADYTTETGLQREIMLADGTHLHLNTDSAVNVRFSNSVRLVELIKGEVLIETGHEAAATYRPFRLQSRHGLVTAIGTRFSVRDHGKHSRVGVFDGAVKVSPQNNLTAEITLHAGQSIEFTSTELSPAGTIKNTETSWSNGIIVVYAMRLDDFAAELSRYRAGILRCDPAISNLIISGSFPTRDTDAALATLARTLPVKIETYTRYWTTIRPA